MRDVVIVGGGPAGLATAIHAAGHGLAVTVVEQRPYPIDKACGEGLMPTAVRRLQEMGITVGGRPFHGIAYVDTTHRVEARFRRGVGHGVRRTWLDDALHRRAEQVGVEFVHGRVDAIDERDNHVAVAGMQARYVVGADGLHSTVRRLAGIPSTSPGPARFGQRRHFRTEPWTDLVEVHWADDAEAYVTPVGEECVSVAILSGRGPGFATRLDAFPALRERLDGTSSGPTMGAGPFRRSVERRRRGRVALVGDAAGYVDALTGEGINVGLAQAEALGECLAHDDLASYEDRWQLVTRTYRRMTLALVRARQQPSLGRRIVPAASHFPKLFDRAVQHLA